MKPRKNTKKIIAGGLAIGGGAPISVQSMTKTDTRDAIATSSQIKRLEDAGCELVRIAVPDMEAAEAFKQIKKTANVPLCADIHFDYRLALAAIKNGADKIRINPGNIGGEKNVQAVAEAAKKARIPIRIGVNSGSLEKNLSMPQSVMKHVVFLESCGFFDIVIAIKASDVPSTVKACIEISEMTDYPLHIGITEAGLPVRGSIKSAAGIGAILSHGIGDTIRVSLTGDPVDEVICAKDILQAMGLRRFNLEFISCPTCGRTEVEMIAIAKKVEKFCLSIDVPLKIAVMGCAVNGPGEAADADFGIACGRGTGAVFKKGKIIRKAPQQELADILIGEIKSYVQNEKIY